MNVYLTFNAAELWHIAGWTMIHFLWLGALIGVIAALCRSALWRAALNIRYGAALACLTMLAVAPVGIATWLIDRSPPLQGGARGGFVSAVEHVATTDPEEVQQIIELSEHAAGMSAPPASVANDHLVAPPTTDEPSPNPSLIEGGISLGAIESFVLYLPWLWLVGSPLTFAVLAAGLIGTKRLRRVSRPIEDPRITDLLARLAASLRVGKRVTIAVCERIASPVIVGIIRPIILLPPAALTGWSPDEIEMVLLHELAHVRRWDNLVNLLQRCIESLLFFHPVVWLVSNWVRREREACCDAIVIGRAQRPHAYAELLVALAAHMPRSVLFHPAASSAIAAGPLRTRIRRILQLEDDPMLISGKSFALMLAGLLLAATLAVLYLPTISQAEQSATEATESTETPDEAKAGAEEPLLRDQFADITFPSRKAAEVSRRAWRILGVRIVPASKDEQSGFAERRLKVLGISPPQPSDGPVFLIEIGGFQTHDFERLDVALDQIEGKKVVVLKCSTKINNKPVLFEHPVRTPDALAQLAPSSEQTDASKSSKFPSLEDQKLADLAWKRLGLELEPIGNDDLRRLQALGYDGGLRVSGKPRSVAKIGADQVGESILTGDILVGLHVWPTRSTKDVADVLAREDLAELNPLKFYVVREEFEESETPGQPPILAGDSVITGRISVHLDSRPGPGTMFVKPSQPAASAPAADLYPAQPLEPSTAFNAMSLQDAVRQFPRFLMIFYSSDEQAATKYQEQVKELGSHDLREVGVALVDIVHQKETAKQYEVKVIPSYVLFHKGKEVTRFAGFQTVEQLRNAIAKVKTNKPAAATENADVPAYVLPPPETEAAGPKAPPVIPTIDPPTDLNRRRASRRPAPLPGVTASNAALRYDGKSFDEWRDLWKNELSTEKRLEAVKALAAFGAHGYGREAAEAILDVAAEYDANNFNHNPLLQAIRDGLISIEPAKAWLPLLRDRFESDPKKWQRLAIETASGAPAADEQERNEKQSFLLLLARSDDYDISSFAIPSLVQLDPALDNQEIKRLVMDQLHNNQYHLVSGVINQFTLYAPQYPPEVVELLLHGDGRQQTTLRQALSRTSGPWEPLIALSAELIAVLKDDAKAADHLAAIRAQAAVGATATRGQLNLRDVLEEIAKTGKLEHQIAAAFALQTMTRRKTQAVPLLDGEARDAAGRKLSAPEIQTLLEKEKEVVFGGTEQ